MIRTDIYGKDLSSLFNSKIASASQRIKPKVVIDWLDSRHTSNLVVTTNDAHANTSQGDIGYYFSPNQAINGIERQSYTWAVAGALDTKGKVIKPDGTWYAMPKDLADNYEFGWWSGTKSSSNAHVTHSGYSFATDPQITFQFDDRKCNLIRVVTSEYYGKIDTYTITVRTNDAGLPDPLYTETSRIQDDSYFSEHYLPISDLGHATIDCVEIVVHSTKNPLDYARIQEVNIVYQEDISDYVISYDTSHTRDLHDSSLPIAGSSSASASIQLDNTNKDFSIFGSSSAFGPYMKKDLKVRISSGWQIAKTDNEYIDKVLMANITPLSNTIVVNENDDIPDGGSGNYFVVTINPETTGREVVLCSSKTGTYDLNVAERGYENTIARSHNIGSVVRFETFEYPNYGEFYVDEWGATTEGMTVTMSCTDWTKFMSEKILTGGFFVEKETVPRACEKLLMMSNFPKGNIDNLDRFSTSCKKLGSILHFDFNEATSDRAGNEINVEDGLRSRFFAMPSSLLNKVTDITADALDKELSELEKALGELSFISPDYVVNSSDISSNSRALDLGDSSAFSFVSNTGDTYSEYFNCVFDGFYTPNENGEQYLIIDIANGGVRVYLDDVLVLNDWRIHPVSSGAYFTIESQPVYLVAGKPYKIRIEAFHKIGDFAIRFGYAVGLNPTDYITPDMVKTVAVLDKIGAKDAPFTPSSTDRNHQQNYGLYLGGGDIGLEGGLDSDSENKSCQLGSSKYVRLPYDESWDVNNSNSVNYTGDWSIELLIKTPSAYSNDGEYLSTWVDSGATSSGFEFYSNSSSHGFKIITDSGTDIASSNTALSTSEWTHIIVSSDGTELHYYVNGELEDTVAYSDSISSWSNVSLTFGGRNAYYDGVTGAEVAPATIRDIFFDEFIIYNSALSEKNVKDRYTEVKMKELTVYPFLYGGENPVRSVIDEITLADLGRFYIDEENIAKYEHYYRLFEPTIDVHANTQATLNDNTHILNADYNVQLQANKVVVKIAGISTNLVGTQSLWRASDPTTLAVVNLESNITANATSMYVSTTVEPPFGKAGYLIIDDEVIKYSSKTPNSFNNLERGALNTTATTHSANAAVREVRYWDLKYDKAPAFQVKNPFITGILFEEPDEISIIRFVPSNYGAELIIAASNNVVKGNIVFAEGTNPLTGEVAYTAIAGIPVVVTEENSQVKEQVADLEENIRLYGLKEISIESKFITDFNHGQKIADFIIDKMSTPVPIINVNTVPTPKLKVGDRISISSLGAFDIINGEYWVLSKSYQYGTSPTQNMMLRKVV